MEVAYYTVNHTIRRRNNVVDLAEYRAKMEQRQRDALRVYEGEAVRAAEKRRPVRQGSVLTRAAELMDVVASAALTVSAFVAMCVAIFVMV